MAKGQVNVLTIEVEGTIYTMTRPGYYYKKTEDGQKRIPKTEWEQAFDAYTAQDEWDTEDEVEARKELEDKMDRETEQNFNGKKVSKPRRSKDIAHESNNITLTTKQVDFIKHIPDTCFYEKGLESTMWCDVLTDEIGGQFAGKPFTVGAMISTLREKDVIYVEVDKFNGKKAKFFGFTELGKKIAKELGLE